ncbi:MAG: hypothetical protein ABL952_04525 [Pyrinomonadaceae bacterium]
MKKSLVLFFLVFAAAASAQTSTATTANQAAYVRPDAERRFKHFVSDTVGPFAWVGIATGAGFSTAINNPKEWGKSANGFGKRFASNFGKNLIKNTAIYGLDEALKLDSHFYRSPKRDLGSRISNAFLSTVTARKPNGKRAIGIPRIVGSYTSDIIAKEVWYPARYGWKDGLKGGSITLGVNAFFNLFREFVLKK